MKTQRSLIRASIALFLVFSFFVSSAFAGEFDMLGSSSHNLLWGQLESDLHDLGDAREADLNTSLQSLEAYQARQTRMQDQYDEMLGWVPEKTPLNPEVTGTITVPGENYTIEKIVYEARPGHRVTANLYLPTEISGTVPGVLIACGHSNEGKAYDSYQRAAILTAKNGMAALIFDPICQGERQQGNSFPGTTEGHTLVGIGARTMGMSAATYEIWDCVRSMDYLASRSEVDASRLGMMGNSGGGTQTAWAMAYDDRIVAAAPSCFITNAELYYDQSNGVPDDEQYFYKQGLYGIEQGDFIAMRAPKPTRVLAADQDYFPLAGAQQAVAEAKQGYALFGAEEKCDLFHYDDPHGFSQPRREAGVQWMKTWLLGDDSPVVEPTLTVQSISTLQCTTTGQVYSSYADERLVPELNLQRAEQLQPAREAFWASTDDATARQTIRDLLMVPTDLGTTDVANMGILDRDGYIIKKMKLSRDGEVPVPALVYVPDNLTEDVPATLYLDGAGKAAQAGVGGAVEDLVQAGQIVMSIDARGFGETSDSTGATYRNDNYRCNALSLYNGQPLLGGRVEDTLSALDVLLDQLHVDASQISIVGVGDAGPVAAHAAAIDTRFSQIALESQNVESWIDDVICEPLSSNRMQHIVPGGLEKYDLPDLNQLLPNEVYFEPEPVEPRVLHWKFDGNLNAEGGQFGGTAVGNAVAGTDNGAFEGSGAVYFDGNNDAVSIPKDVLDGSPATISFWSKTANAGGTGYFICDSSDVQNFFLRRYKSSTGEYTYTGWVDEILFDEAGPDGTKDTTWPINEWHQQTLVIDEHGTVTWYIDGEEFQSIMGTDFEGLTSNLYLGNRATLDRDLTGWIDDLQIYNWELSPEQVQQLFENPGETVSPFFLEGDLNGDGLVGSGDLDIVRAYWGQSVSVGDFGSGDANADGVVGSADLDIIRANWGSTAAAAVPEPGVVGLLAVVLMGVVLRRK